MRIQDVEAGTGLDRATIRYYEKEGIIHPFRQENGYRQYSDSDVDLLLKVKLLRQLGVSIHAIKCLQKGSATFSEVLTQQIQILEGRIQEDTKAKYICQQIQSDGVSFSELNAVHYLSLYQKHNPNLQVFEENAKREVHPWRRYFARVLDYSWIRLLVLFIITCVIRIRPIDNLGIEIIGLVCGFLAVPILALMLHSWGTTPGKWLLGIAIEDANGGKLSYQSAFERESYLVQYGVCFFIPILSQWRMYSSYQEETRGEQNNWNHNCEILYTDRTAGKRALLAGVIILLSAVSVLISTDSVYFPQYRRENLTISQFAENHLDYEKAFDIRSELRLGTDGTWQEDIDTGTYYFTFDDMTHPRPEYVYELDRGGIRSIQFHDQWVTDGFLPVIPSHCEAALHAFVGSRPLVTLKEMNTLDSLTDILVEQIRNAMEIGSITDEMQLGDVLISWNIEFTGADGCGNEFVFSAENEMLTYSLDLTMEIIP